MWLAASWHYDVTPKQTVHTHTHNRHVNTLRIHQLNPSSNQPAFIQAAFCFFYQLFSELKRQQNTLVNVSPPPLFRPAFRFCWARSKVHRELSCPTQNKQSLCMPVTCSSEWEEPLNGSIMRSHYWTRWCERGDGVCCGTQIHSYTHKYPHGHQGYLSSALCVCIISVVCICNSGWNECNNK